MRRETRRPQRLYEFTRNRGAPFRASRGRGSPSSYRRQILNFSLNFGPGRRGRFPSGVTGDWFG